MLKIGKKKTQKNNEKQKKKKNKKKNKSHILLFINKMYCLSLFTFLFNFLSCLFFSVIPEFQQNK